MVKKVIVIKSCIECNKCLTVSTCYGIHYCQGGDKDKKLNQDKIDTEIPNWCPLDDATKIGLKEIKR